LPFFYTKIIQVTFVVPFFLVETFVVPLIMVYMLGLIVRFFE